MDIRAVNEASALVALPGLHRQDESPLASLAAAPMAGRLCAWRGASDTRYVASVYAANADERDGGLPDFESFVLIAVGRSVFGRRILDVRAIERASDRRLALASAPAQGVVEWHVHFLAEDRPRRSAMVADLRARHCPEAAARCA